MSDIARDRVRRFEGASPQFLNQFINSLDKTAILSGCELEHVGGLEVRVTAGDVMLDGRRLEWGGGEIAVDPGESYARKDTVYLRPDGSGLELAVERGAAASKRPSSAEAPIEYYSPIEHDMAGIEGVPVGVVFVDTNAGTLDEETDLWQWRPTPDASPGALAGVEFAYPEGGSEGVQAALNALPESGGEVWLAGGEYDWPTTPELPARTGLRALGDVVAKVPTDHDLTDLEAPHEGPLRAAITNADRTLDWEGYLDGPATDGVSVRGIEVDFSDVEDPNDDDIYHAGVWLYGAPGSTLEDVHAHDVQRETSGRAYGVLLTDSPLSTVENCIAERCGYEGIGFRGQMFDSEINYCEAYDNGTHSAQIAGFTGDQTSLDRPFNITVRGGTYDGNFILHGVKSTERATDDRDHNIVLDRVTADRIQVYECVENVRIHECTAMVRFSARGGLSDRHNWVRDIVVDGLHYNGALGSPIDIEAVGDDPAPVIEDIELSRIHNTEDANFATIRVSDRGSGTDDPQFRRVTLRDTNVKSDWVIESTDGNELDEFRVINCNLEGIEDVPRHPDLIHISHASGNIGWDAEPTEQLRTRGILEDWATEDLRYWATSEDISPSFVSESFTDSPGLHLEGSLGDRLISEHHPYRPRVGDRLSMRILHDSTGHRATVFVFGAQDLNNFYGLQVMSGLDEFRIVKIENGDYNTLASVSETIPGDEWLEMRVEQWRADGFLCGAVYDEEGVEVARISTTDSTAWTEGYVGLRNGSHGGYSVVDLIKVMR